ncbi:MAG: hypothetical protein HC819_21515 [Cyclobacteriaceae bacterium]|nr:hypothetical protein [Cyclobacteriaceae bacterium]
MKALSKVKSITFSIILLMGLVLGFNVSHAQEYDDMYFQKSDRKTVKVENLSAANKSLNGAKYKEIAESTESYSSKNINPEYIARYQNNDSGEASEDNTSYNSQDYFVEDYNDEYISNSSNEIDYAALNRRDQMSTPYYKRSFANSSWGFNPYMAWDMVLLTVDLDTTLI